MNFTRTRENLILIPKRIKRYYLVRFTLRMKYQIN